MLDKILKLKAKSILLLKAISRILCVSWHIVSFILIVALLALVFYYSILPNYKEFDLVNKQIALQSEIIALQKNLYEQQKQESQLNLMFLKSKILESSRACK